MKDWQATFSARGRSLQPSAIRETTKLGQQPGIISFAGGSPDPALFPYEAIEASLQRIMADGAKRVAAFQYGASEGYPPLRALIADQLNATGAKTGAAEILITSGSQQALEFLGTLFIEAGDRIIVTNPTYIGALQAFSLFEPEFVGIPSSEDGIDLGALEQAFARGAKFMYLMPDFGNPSGTTIPLAQRRAILDLARRHGVPIVEDQAYEQLRLSGERLPTMLALDSEMASADAGRNVIYLGTFSKSLMPGLRVGWIVAPAAVLEKLVSIKQASDLHTGALGQIIVCDLAGSILGDHAKTLRASYRERRDAMLAALERHMPEGVSWNRPDGGMFVWLTVPEELDAKVLQRRALDDEQVLFVPGAPFFVDGSGRNTLRLSFSLAKPAAIETGIKGLAAAIRASLPQTETSNSTLRASYDPATARIA